MEGTVETTIPRCAGLDVHKKSVVAAVRVIDENGELQTAVKRFGTTTRALRQLDSWLSSFGVTTVGMESTGVYWKPIYRMLEPSFACLLLNAQHMHNVPGRKTDMADAAWIAQLVAYGLVRASFIPPKDIRELRELTRYRKTLIQERSREVQRLHKVLEDTGIKLGNVATDILGKSARAMLEALIAGDTDPEALAELARGRMRNKLSELSEALEGEVAAVHQLMLRELLAHIDYLDETIARLSIEIEQRCGPFAQAIELLDTIPGINQRTAEVLVSEFGTDMQRFGCAQRLASWAGVCPGNNESAGKHFTGKTRKGSPWLRTALVEAAQTCVRAKDGYLKAQYARIKGRHGHSKAIVAVAHSMLIIAYHALDRQQPYQELGGDYFIQRQNNNAYRRRLVGQLERMGYDVALTEKAA